MLLASLKHGFTHAFDFSSTTQRALFWYWVLANFLIFAALGLLDAFVVGPALGFSPSGNDVVRPLSSIYSLVILVPWLAIGVRRLRDGGFSPWLILLAFIPFLNLALLYFYVQPSKAA